MFNFVEAKFNPQVVQNPGFAFRVKTCGFAVAQLVAGAVDSIIFFPALAVALPVYFVTGHQWTYVEKAGRGLNLALAKAFESFMRAYHPKAKFDLPKKDAGGKLLPQCNSPFFCDAMLLETHVKIEIMAAEKSFIKREVASRVMALSAMMLAPVAVAADLASIPFLFTAAFLSGGNDVYLNNRMRNALYMISYVGKIVTSLMKVALPY